MKRFVACAFVPSPASSRVLFSTTFSRLSSSAASQDCQSPPSLLTESQVDQFHRDGFVVVEDAISTLQLDHLSSVVRTAALNRGVRFVPESDKQHRPNSVEFDATLHEAMPADQRHRLGPNGQHEATFERRERRIKIKCRNRKEMERAYKKIVSMRQQYAQYKGVDLAPKAPGNLAVPNAALTHEQQTRQRELMERQDAAAQQQQRYEKVKPQSRVQTNNEGFSENADDDVDVHAFNKEKARQSFDTYRNSGKMEEDVRKGSHLDEAFAHVYNGAQSWMHLWPKDNALRDAVFGRKIKNNAAEDCVSIGNYVGSIGAQLAGVMTTRLYTDCIIQRTPFCNPLPYHYDASGLNYRDSRGLQATIVLSGSAQPLDEHHGGYVVLPGSHRVIRTITNDCRDQTGFVRPASWEVGEALRAFPQLLSIQPYSLGHLRPGTVVFFSNLLVYSNGPNFATGASESGRQALYSNEYKIALAQQSKPAVEDSNAPAPKAAMFINEAPLTYALSIMPDGVSFDGVRNTWMSKDSHGPLYNMEVGQPLRNPALFPVLYSEIPDTL